MGDSGYSLGTFATEWSGGKVINLAGLPGATFTVAFGINDAGQAVGYSFVSESSLPALSNAANALNGEAATGAATASIGLGNQFLSLMLDPLVYGPAVQVRAVRSGAGS